MNFVFRLIGGDSKHHDPNSMIQVSSKFTFMQPLPSHRLVDFYSSLTPRLSVKIDGSSQMNLDVPYQFQVKLHHHANAAGNPQNRPVTLCWKDTALGEISDTEISPWLFLHHAGENLEGNSKPKELDDGNNGPGFAQMNDESEEQPEISEANGFFSLAVDEARVVRVEFKYTGDGLQLQRGQKYSFGFRGSRVHWWTWGTLNVRYSISQSLHR